MAISEKVQEDYDGLVAKYLGKKAALPKAIQKRMDYVRDNIMGTAAIIMMVAVSLAAAVAISALRKTPKEIPKLLQSTQYSASLDAGFIQKAQQLIQAADTKTSNNLYESWKNSQVSPELFQCAQELDAAADSIGAMNPELAKSELIKAEQLWTNAVKQMGSTEETKLLLNRIINTKQALVELGVEMQLIRASTIVEVISDDIFPGIPAKDKTQKSVELAMLKKFVTQMESSVSIQNPKLTQKVKNILAQIDALAGQLSK